MLADDLTDPEAQRVFFTLSEVHAVPFWLIETSLSALALFLSLFFPIVCVCVCVCVFCERNEFLATRDKTERR